MRIFAEGKMRRCVELTLLGWSVVDSAAVGYQGSSSMEIFILFCVDLILDYFILGKRRRCVIFTELT